MKKVAEYVGLSIAVLLMSVAVFTYVGPHFGWRVDAVLSGSMEPSLKTGSLVLTRSVEPEIVAVGDIITFRPATNGKNLITHRVIGIGQSSSRYFETKGDANKGPDPFTVPARNLVGKISFHAPYWGYVTEFLKTPLGFLFAVVIPGSILLALYIINVYRALTMKSKQVVTEVVRNES
jgi:signal peptidase